MPAPSVLRTCTLVWLGRRRVRARTDAHAVWVRSEWVAATHSSVYLKKLRLTKADLSLESRTMLQNAAPPVKDGTKEAPWPHVHSSLPPVLPVNAAVRHGVGAQEDAFAPADIDGSGGLTLDEWMHAFRGKGGAKAHVLRAFFDDFDADQDRSVSLAEFQAGVEPRSLFKWALLSAQAVLWRLVNALSAFGLESGSAGGQTEWGSGGAELHSDMERSIVDLLLLAFADFLIGLRLSSVLPTCVPNCGASFLLRAYRVSLRLFPSARVSLCMRSIVCFYSPLVRLDSP